MSNAAAAGRAPALAWAVAARAFPGQQTSGDLHVVREFADGAMLAVVDALGHGPEAEATARLAVATLEHYAHEAPLGLVERCHRILSGTRGAAMSLGSIDWMDRTMTWTAIGDVEGRVFPWATGRPPPARSLMRQAGIVGAGMPTRVRQWVVPIAAGDLLVLATDGVRPTFADGVRVSDTPQQIADGILAGFAKGTDDALVLVARIPPPMQDRAS